MTDPEFKKVATCIDLLQSMAVSLNSLITNPEYLEDALAQGARKGLEDAGVTHENIGQAFDLGAEKTMEFSRQAGQANEEFFYALLRENREKFPIVDCVLIREDGRASSIWTPMDIPPSYRDIFFHSLHHRELFNLLYRDKQQLFFLEEDRQDLGQVIEDSEVWTYGVLGNSREDVVCSSFVQNPGRLGHLEGTYVMGQLNHHQNKGRIERIPGIRINEYPGIDKPVVITPFNQIEMAAAGVETMAEKHGWKRIEVDAKKYPDLYRQFVLAAFDAYIEETKYEHPAIFWHMPKDRSTKS